jgi:hypothetical protein
MLQFKCMTEGHSRRGGAHFPFPGSVVLFGNAKIVTGCGVNSLGSGHPIQNTGHGDPVRSDRRITVDGHAGGPAARFRSYLASRVDSSLAAVRKALATAHLSTCASPVFRSKVNLAIRFRR